MGDEVGGLSTSLGLFAIPLLIHSTESVVVMKQKVMSTSIAASEGPGKGHPCCNQRAHAFHSITTTDSVESISRGLAKSPSEVLNLPTSSPTHVVLRQ